MHQSVPDRKREAVFLLNEQEVGRVKSLLWRNCPCSAAAEWRSRWYLPKGSAAFEPVKTKQHRQRKEDVMGTQERVSKILSACGVCSRRAAEALIEAGRVRVNGGAGGAWAEADAETDEICVDGKRLSCSVQFCYLMLHKPRGYVTTVQDEKGRRTVMDLVAEVPGGCGRWGGSIWIRGTAAVDQRRCHDQPSSASQARSG